MLISYNSQTLQEICFQDSTAVEYLGEEVAISLQARHSDLQAADNVFELPVGKVDVDGSNCVLSFGDHLSVKMVSNYGPPQNGEIYDWKTVQRVKIMGINDVQ